MNISKEDQAWYDKQTTPKPKYEYVPKSYHKKKAKFKRLGTGPEHQIAKECLLALCDLGAFVFHAATTGSVYIKFDTKQMGSLQIRDHTGRQNEGEDRYKYRWNLYLHQPRMERYNGNRRFYGALEVEQLLEDLIEFHRDEC